MIEILEQGIWPNKPSDEMIHEEIFFYNETDWMGVELDCLAGCLLDGEPWLVLSKPEKALEDMTEAELIEMWKTQRGNGDAVSINPLKETLREALIRNLK